MAEESPELMVRRHERYRCALGGRLHIADLSAPMVRLSRSAARAEGIGATVVDCSAGGLGLRTSLFLPKACRVRVRIPLAAVGSAGVTHGPVPAGPEALEATVRVQRVTMLDRSPTYYIGTAFVDLSEPQQRAVLALLDLARDSGDGCAAGEGGRAVA